MSDVVKVKIFARDEKFRFECRRDLGCFNTCCRNVNIFLTPYDVLRMKNKLGLKSGEFLARYTTRLDKGNIPFVLLKMREDADLACPFVTPDGCSIYDVRAWSCRIAPVDLRKDGYTFIFDSDTCFGLNEDREWTLDEWYQDQGLKIYEEKEKLFREVPAHIAFTGMKNLDNHIKEMVYLACYDLDRFRRFVFETRFREVFYLDEAEADKIRRDDEALMQYAFRWLKEDFDVGETLELRDELPAGDG